MRTPWVGVAIFLVAIASGSIFAASVEEAVKVKSDVSKTQDTFGNSVAISGSTAVIGAPYEDVGVPQRTGAVYVFVRNGAEWKLQQKLTAYELDAPVDLRYVYNFGASVAISGNTILVGSHVGVIAGAKGVAHGVAHTFDRAGTLWSPRERLTADDGEGEDSFGDAVAINGDLAIVGSPFTDPSGGSSQLRGAAFVFKRTKTRWQKQTRLIADDGMTANEFGISVAINGDTAVVGSLTTGDTQTESKGAAYVFVQSGGGWAAQKKLEPPPQGGGFFGYSVGISGNNIVVGAPSHDVGNNRGQGAAYAFIRNGTIWSAPLPLLPSDGAAGDAFGTRVAVSGNGAVVSSHLKDVNGLENQGKASVFQRDGAGWERTSEITADDGARFQAFGLGLAISGDTVVAGAPGDNNARGAAYIYQNPDTDGDGIPDSWERYGITVDEAGNVIGSGKLDGGEFIDLKAMGADPMHKDLFVHADWMAPNPALPNVRIKPTAAVMKMASDTFQRAPVPNPDGRNGINLHVDLGPDSVMNPSLPKKWGDQTRAGEVPFQTTLGSHEVDPRDATTTVYNWNAFDLLKAKFFTPSRRRAVFHYMLFCNNYDGAFGSSGLSRGITSADFLVALGQAEGRIKPIGVAATFVHEFGHNLGLRHGGTDFMNRKPNYLSTMNYTFQILGLVKAVDGRRLIDFSRRELPELNEKLLSETAGIGEPAFLTFWRGHPKTESPYYRIFANGALDWNVNGIKDAGTVEVDLNNEDGLTKLPGAEDWSKLRYDGGGLIGNSAGADAYDHAETQTNETSIDDLLVDLPAELLNEETVAPHDVATVTTHGAGSLIASFDGTASTAVNGSIVSWVWDFGDGTSGTGATTDHTYSTPGAYFATLTVTDSDGHVNLIPLLIEVNIQPPPPPTPTPIPPPGPGDVDPTFNAAVTTTAGLPVFAAVVQPDGKLIVGGDFEAFGGQARRNLARLNSNGTVDASFDPALLLTDAFNVSSTVGSPKTHRSLPVQAIALQPDGKILVGVQSTRGFKDGASAASRMILRLNADGTRDPSFDAPGFDSGFSVPQVRAIVVQPDGKILVGGGFIYENNGPQNAIVRLNSDGSIDPSFVLPPSAPYGGPRYFTGAGGVYAIALQGDGKMVIGGSFENVGSTTRPSIARLNANGSLDVNYNAPAASAPSGFASEFSKFSAPAALAFQPDGKLIVAGYLTPNGAIPYPIARLNADGSRDASFTRFFEHTSQGAGGLALQPDGKIVVGGDFESSAPASRKHFARLNPDGTLDASFDTSGTNRSVYAVVLQNTGKVIAAGEFNSFNDAAAEGIARLNTDGTRDDAFVSNGPGNHNQVNALVRQPDGRLLVGFSYYGGTGASGQPPVTKLNGGRAGSIGRLNPDGTLDTSFTSPFSTSIVWTIALQTDGKAIVAGSFTLIGSTDVLTFVRLNQDGSLDTTFHPPSAAVGDTAPIAIQPDGKILTSGYDVSGFFGVLRLNPDGTLDPTFSRPLPNGGAGLIALQPDGRIVIAGFFYLPDDRPAQLARLNADGSFDSSFNPGTGPDNTVWALLLQPDGKVLLSGKFDNYDGVARNRIARVNSDGSLDTTFLPYNPDSTHDSEIRALALQLDGKLVAGSYYGGRSLTLPPNRVFRLNTDGSLDPSLPQMRSGTEGFSNNVNAIALQPGGQIVIGGEFQIVNDTAHLAIARLLGTPPTVLANISTRLRVEPGENALIGGFIITGTGQKRLLLRAIAPSLPLAGRLDDPQLELYSASGQVIATNDDWQDSADADAIQATAIPPSNTLEASILANVNPGAYTAIVRGRADSSGIAVVEAYDLDASAGSKLANISTRGLVQSGDNAMIGGFIMVGSAPAKVIVRAIGPSLSKQGLAGALQDPTLELYDSNGQKFASDDDWRTGGQEAEIIASTIPPSEDAEAAIVATLTPAGYTAIVRGANGTTGVAVVEVYALQ